MEGKVAAFKKARAKLDSEYKTKLSAKEKAYSELEARKQKVRIKWRKRDDEIQRDRNRNDVLCYDAIQMLFRCSAKSNELTTQTRKFEKPLQHMQPPLPLRQPIDGHASSLESYDADIHLRLVDCEYHRAGLILWINDND